MLLGYFSLRVTKLIRCLGLVTGASVYAHIKSNSTYAQMFIRSIYETRWLKIPHLPICHCKQPPPQGPASQPRYIESCPATAQIYATSRPTPTVLLTVWSPRELHCCVKSLPAIAPGIQHYPHHWNHHFCSGHCFWLVMNVFDSSFWLDPTHLFWMDLTHLLFLYLTHRFQLNLTQFFPIGYDSHLMRFFTIWVKSGNKDDQIYAKYWIHYINR